MILYPDSDEEFELDVRILRAINELRGRGPGYFPPVMADTPWIQTRRAKECYL